MSLVILDRTHRLRRWPLIGCGTGWARQSMPGLCRTHWRAVLRPVLLATLLLALAGCASDASLHLTFLDPQGPVASAQRWHFYWVLAIMAVMVAGPIFVLLPFWAWRYRYGNKTSKYTPKWEFSRLLELMAWGGPLAIVVILAIFVWRDTHKLDPYKPLASRAAPLRVDVVSYDWKWLFIYPDQGIASIGTFAMPVGRPVSLHLTSGTVMQSFFIPALGSQIYTMGGMVTRLNLQASQPGQSLGENTMYNGNGFHQQQFAAVALRPEDFHRWVASARRQGMVLDADTLKLIARKGTRADLRRQLNAPATGDGSIYFTGVTAALFPAVVKAVRDGSTALPPAAFAPVNGKPSTPGRVSTVSTKKEQSR